jgi:hypothetical protein
MRTLQQLRVLDSQPPDFQGAMRDCEHDVDIEWLLQIVECAHVHGANRTVDRPLTGHDDTRKVRIDASCRADQREAIDLRHLQIGEHYVVASRLKFRQSLSARRIASRFVAVQLERMAERLHLRDLIVHDENPG